MGVLTHGQIDTEGMNALGPQSAEGRKKLRPSRPFISWNPCHPT